jgi:hypothetical protein
MYQEEKACDSSSDDSGGGGDNDNDTGVACFSYYLLNRNCTTNLSTFVHNRYLCTLPSSHLSYTNIAPTDQILTLPLA